MGARDRFDPIRFIEIRVGKEEEVRKILIKSEKKE